MKKTAFHFLIYLSVMLCLALASVLKDKSSTAPNPFVPTPDRHDEMDTVFADEIERTLNQTIEDRLPSHTYALPTRGRAQSLLANSEIRMRDIKSHPIGSEKSKNDKGYVFFDSKKNRFAATKLGKDFQHHFMNSFLVGYRPFAVSEIWMPHQVISMRLKYQFDKDQFAGFREVWLSSYQAFKSGRGDCEDHSIALADWLIDMGEDARVVTGTQNGNGHAWVVVIRDAGTFLLEATSKRRRRLWSSYPLASLAKGYVPKSMFNREYYWTNSDTTKYGDYTGTHWTKAGRITH